MPTKIFVNLPVRDLDRSMTFFKKLGFSFNPQFTDETAACMIISNDIYAMLLTHKKFGEFTKKTIADARTTTEVLTCLSRDSRAEVDALVDAALAAGGTMVTDQFAKAWWVLADAEGNEACICTWQDRA